VQSVNVDSDLVFAQILGGAARLSQLRPELAQPVTSLFSGIDMYLSEGEPRLAAARRNVEQVRQRESLCARPKGIARLQIALVE
jgi:hypothetical protein